MLYIILVQGFCPLKIKITQFSDRFRLKLSISAVEFLAGRTQVISNYKPPINFRAHSLDETHKVVRKWDGGYQAKPPARFDIPSFDFIDERKTRKKVNFSGFNFSNLITV